MIVIVLFFFTFYHLPYGSSAFGTEFCSVFNLLSTIGAFFTQGLTAFGTELAIGRDHLSAVGAGFGSYTAARRTN